MGVNGLSNRVHGRPQIHGRSWPSAEFPFCAHGCPRTSTNRPFLSTDVHRRPWNVYLCPWTSAGVHGLCFRTHGRPPASMDCQFLSADAHGRPWTSVDGRPCIQMDGPWASMDAHGQPVNAYARPWTSVGTNEHSWASVDTNG